MFHLTGLNSNKRSYDSLQSIYQGLSVFLLSAVGGITSVTASGNADVSCYERYYSQSTTHLIMEHMIDVETIIIMGL
jgi:hypothetical protein